MALNRKEWLELFLTLADRNKPAMEFRKKLGIGFNVLSKHVASIPAYRAELAAILAEAAAPAALAVHQVVAIASGEMPLPFTCAASS